MDSKTTRGPGQPPRQPEGASTKSIRLRMPPALCERIDEQLEGESRNDWIVQAIRERLEG